MLEAVYKGSPQIKYVLGKYKIAIEITGRNEGKIVTVMGDYNTMGPNNIKGIFTGF